MHVWMHGRKEGWLKDGKMDEWLTDGRINRCIYVIMDGWKEGGMVNNGWMDAWTDCAKGMDG